MRSVIINSEGTFYRTKININIRNGIALSQMIQLSTKEGWAVKKTKSWKLTASPAFHFISK